jgi:hypothetical protein
MDVSDEERAAAAEAIALEKSIKQWEEKRDAFQPSDLAGKMGASACALCVTFRRENAAGIQCGGCPVKASTGRDHCHGSPYEEAYRAFSNWDRSSRNGDDTDTVRSLRNEFWQAAQAELDFLRSLRQTPKQVEVKRDFVFQIGDCVCRNEGAGYDFPGIVVARWFKYSKTKVLYAVESTSDGTVGMTHIFREEDLRIR